MSVILLRRRSVDAVIPCGKFEGDAGMDLTYIGPSRIIWPWQVLDLDTGWDIKIPDGYFGNIKSRSSTFAKRKLMLLEGIVDSGYSGPLSVVVVNPSPIPRIIGQGDRLGQLLILKLEQCWVEVVSALPEGSRGHKGFGSSGL